MNEVHLEILHFDDYLFRKDYKTIHWAKFDVDFLSHPDFFDLSGDELKVYIHFICIASKMRNSKIRMNLKHTAHTLRIKEAAVKNAIFKLEAKRWKSLAANESVQIPTDSDEKRANRTVQNSTEHNEHNITEHNTATESSANISDRRCLIIFSSNYFVKELFNTCTEEIQHAWIAAYSDKDWISQEALKANAWIKANPKKASKNFQRFFNNWLSRAFEDYRKTISSSRKESKDEFVERMKNKYKSNEAGL